MGEVIDLDPFKRLPERFQQRARDIASRVRDIDAMMSPCAPAMIGEAVVRMFRQFREQPGVDHSNMGVEFKAACRDLPEWALSEAANDFLAGRVDNHTGQYMPTCAEFAKRARSILLPMLAERSALRVEASKLVERAADEHRRDQIAIERTDPAVRRRVAELTEKVTAGAAKKQALTHSGVSPETKRSLDALRKPVPFKSKIDQTKIGRQ